MPNAPSQFTKTLAGDGPPQSAVHLDHFMQTLGGRIPIFGTIEHVTGLFEGGCHDWQDRRLTRIACVLPDDAVYPEPRTGLPRASVTSDADKLAAHLRLEPQRVSVISDEFHQQEGGISMNGEWALAAITLDDWYRLQAEGTGLTIVASSTSLGGVMLKPTLITRRVFPGPRRIPPPHAGLNPFTEPLVFAAKRPASIEYRMQSGVTVIDERRDCLGDLKWVLRLKSEGTVHHPRCAVDDHRYLAQDVLDTLLAADDVDPSVVRSLVNRALITLFGSPLFAGLPATERSGIEHSVLTHEMIYDDITFGNAADNEDGRRHIAGYHLPAEDLLNPKRIIIRDAPIKP
ncbi:MAG: hypothetical protein Q8R16_04005 [bacterium]|nr:hypothetical protein [bacterium]